MKQTVTRTILILGLFALLILTNIPLAERPENRIFSLPGLPRPIARSPVIITSAGQSTDAYIIRDISNQLMIQNYFMPQAKETDLEDINTVVFVVGYSSFGMKLQNISYTEEKERISKLVEKSKQKKLTVLTISIGGVQPHDKETEELLKLVCGQSDYIIGIRESCNESVLAELAADSDIPLTLVNEVNDISGAFASAFR